MNKKADKNEDEFATLKPENADYKKYLKVTAITLISAVILALIIAFSLRYFGARKGKVPPPQHTVPQFMGGVDLGSLAML